MHIKHRWAALLMLLPICLAIAHAEAMSVNVPETDPEVFTTCLVAVGYSLPDGYEMEGFFRADVNDDGIMDMISTLDQTNGNGRLLVLIQSGPTGYLVTENNVALPETGNEAQDFLGMEAGENYISLYTSKNDGKHQEYRFAREGEQFRLSTMTFLDWDDRTGEAVQERFDFFTGEYSMTFGKVQEDTYVPAGESAKHLFTGHLYSPDLKDFDLKQIPTTWDGLEPLVVADQGENVGGDGSISESPSLEPMVFCNACGNWYVEGDAFRNHVCAANQMPVAFKCEACGVAFVTEKALAEHICPEAQKSATIQCTVCGLWYAEGAEFRNHVCVSYPASNQVFCDVCGGRFEEGDAFRTHICKPASTPEALPTKPAPTASPPPMQTMSPTPGHGGATPPVAPTANTTQQAPSTDALEPPAP